MRELFLSFSQKLFAIVEFILYIPLAFYVFQPVFEKMTAATLFIKIK